MPTVLYTEDEPSLVAVVSEHFERMAPDFSLEIATTGRDCLGRMRRGGIDVLLLDLRLPDIDGLHVLGELALRQDPTPVVMVSSLGQTELAVRALRAGAVECVDKSTPQFLHLVDLVRRVHARHRQPAAQLPAEPRSRHRILLLEKTAAVGAALRDFIRQSAPQLELTVVENPAPPAVLLAGPERNDAVIIGPHPPGAGALDLVRELHSLAPELPVLVLTAQGDAETAAAAFKLGAQDFLPFKPGYEAELVFSLGHILRQAEMARRNTRLTAELDALNRSLEAQVTARTQELAALSRRLIQVQEEERRAVAHELHDQLGQLLTGLTYQLERAADTEPVRGARQLAGELMQQLRDLTLRLRPKILDDLGLAAAVDWQVRRFRQQTGIAVEADLSLPAERLPAVIEITAFRLVQEALTNLARHSGATAAVVTIAAGPAHLIVEVGDRGRGFDVAEALAARRSLGLAGMRERVQFAGGQLEIFSRPGHGTRIHAELPLATPSP